MGSRTLLLIGTTDLKEDHVLRFRIANMGCGGCAKGVTRVVRIVDPDAQVTFDLQTREVSIQGCAADADRFDRELRSAGWKSERVQG
nr:heavy-metal-associated domain-containing protein [Neoroseomonas soli]